MQCDFTRDKSGSGVEQIDFLFQGWQFNRCLFVRRCPWARHWTPSLLGEHPALWSLPPAYAWMCEWEDDSWWRSFISYKTEKPVQALRCVAPGLTGFKPNIVFSTYLLAAFCCTSANCSVYLAWLQKPLRPSGESELCFQSVCNSLV